MIFNSIEYALFLPIVLAGYWLLPRRATVPWLLVASYVFYGAWDWRFLGLLFVSTAVDYAVGLALGRADADATRKRLLLVSIVVNLGILGFFKYFGFFTDSAQDLLGRMGWEVNEVALSFLLPVGISFYTFQSMSYTFDVYRRRIEPCRRPLVFALYVAFFPQLVAGPIERARHLLPQLEKLPRPPRGDRIESGLALVLLGLVKKVVVADTVAPIVNEVFADPAAAGTIGVLIGTIGFAVQIYFDFSGYTDIARGTARLLGVELMHNFRQPYLSRSITEFWRRWHISLSRWLRDYLYIPLGGNQRGPVRTYFNLLVTMVLGGLWHGASWHFVVWGAIHGVLLATERRFRRHADKPGGLPRLRDVPAVLSTFALVCFAWIFFRAVDLANALDVLDAFASLDWTLPPADDVWTVALALVAVVGIDLVLRARSGAQLGAALRAHPAMTGVLVGLSLVGLAVFSGDSPVPFIYFQF